MSEQYYFTCPKCGSHYFGRDTEAADAGPTVRCHAPKCMWRGEWPVNEVAK